MSESSAKVKSLARSRPVSMNGNGKHDLARVDVRKTYKLYIGGKFPRSESGRYYKLEETGGDGVVSICRGSRKDARDAVTAARKAQPVWASKTAYNKGQILYRIAETLEGRSAQFVETLRWQGTPKTRALAEVHAAIDRLVYYAGWTDKYSQVFSSVNPVESSHFNFSFPEPTGVVGMAAPAANGLIGPVSLLGATLAGGNTLVMVCNAAYPLTAIELAEVVHASDVPGGTVNLLTGTGDEMILTLAAHMDVNAFVYCGTDPNLLGKIKTQAAANVKRVVHYPASDWSEATQQSPYHILDLQEVKTTWHPIGI